MSVEEMETEKKVLVERLREIEGMKPKTASCGPDQKDPWAHRTEGMKCRTCMFFVRKARTNTAPGGISNIGRCRRNAPTMKGYPVVFEHDWCGEHKLNENV